VRLYHCQLVLPNITHLSTLSIEQSSLNSNAHEENQMDVDVDGQPAPGPPAPGPPAPVDAPITDFNQDGGKV
jgi:hypothetical protein